MLRLGTQLDITTREILTTVRQSFGGRVAITSTRKVSDLIRELVLGGIPVPPAMFVLRRVLYPLRRPHVAIPERGQTARRSFSEGV